MNGVSKQTMADLIKYMYNGEVEINPDALADFLEKAKSLEIEGICDDNYWQTSDQQPPNHLTRNVAGPSHSSIQYQTSHVNRFHQTHVSCDQMLLASTISSSRQPPNNQFAYSNDSAYDDSNGSSYEEVYVPIVDYDSNIGSGDLMDQDVQWDRTYDDDDDEDFNPITTKAFGAPTAKRVKQTNANIGNLIFEKFQNIFFFSLIALT